MGAAAFGATVAGVPPPQTIVVGGAAGGTMEGPLEEATQFCVTKAAARNLALFSCQIWVYKNERADFHFLRAESAP